MMNSEETAAAVEEAIVEALVYENKVRDVYRQACDQTQDEVGRKVFEVLADEEQGHVDYLESKLATLRACGEITSDDISSALPSRQVVQENIAKLKETLAPTRDRGSEEALLRKALAVEEETSEFYRRMVHELPPQGQAFFRPFLAIEDGHVAIVQAELDSVTGLGFWFDYQEFDLEAG